MIKKVCVKIQMRLSNTVTFVFVLLPHVVVIHFFVYCRKVSEGLPGSTSKIAKQICEKNTE